jgi:hypothetical protein
LSLPPLEDTIVAGNTAGGTGPDLHGPITGAFSLIGNPAGSTVTEAVPGSNLLGVDPQLGPLANSGGPTATMALTAISPAVNRGSGGYTVDQRGDPRPVAFPGVPFSASALAKLRLKAGKTALLTLRPKPKYAARLALAKKILVLSGS